MQAYTCKQHKDEELFLHVLTLITAHLKSTFL